MSFRDASLAALLGATLFCEPTGAASTDLLSIKGIQIDEMHHLTKVEIRTWGVEVLAVCHVPPVSIVSVDFDIDPGGILKWKSNSWHGELTSAGLKELYSIFLVNISDYQKEPRGDPRSQYHPASFEGSATITSIDEPPRERVIKLRSDNFGLMPATRCPDIKPVQNR